MRNLQRLRTECRTDGCPSAPCVAEGAILFRCACTPPAKPRTDGGGAPCSRAVPRCCGECANTVFSTAAAHADTRQVVVIDPLGERRDR